ncbi:MAG: hypothetical protein Q7T82_17070 [Armatimonadota bacterium]|nr:hypothetical protein [Armatimonadota bacterium]
MRTRWCSLEWIFLAVAALLLIYILFVPPMVGLANSGDFARMMDWFGLSYRGNTGPETQFLFVNRVFAWHPKVEPHYPSSALLFLAAALPASPVLVGRGLFDIRLLGVAYVCGFLLALFLLTRYARTLSLRSQLVLYAVTALVFLDVGYVAYFNSFYAEPGSLIFLTATLACAFIAVSRDRPSGRAWIPVAGFFIASFLFASAKVQNAVSALPLAFIAYGLVRIAGRSREARPGKRSLVALALAVLLAVAFLGYYGMYVKFSRKIHKEVIYLNVFHEILARSYSPEDDLREMGLDPSLAPLAGTTLASPGVPPGLVDVVASKVGYRTILKYYMRHPDRFIELAEDAAENAFLMRPTYLGNYEKSFVLRDGPRPVYSVMDMPSEYRTGKFALWSSLKEAFPKSLWLVFSFLSVNILAIAAKWLRFDRAPGDRMITKLHGALVVMAGLQFLIVILGEGLYEIAKHLFLFNLLCDVCLVFLIMYAVNIGAILPHRAVGKQLE